MDQQIYMLGMPGLYQNWLQGALDSNSLLLTIDDYNFYCANSGVKWIKKFDYLDSPSDINGIGINTYVKDNNFVWYLYNFLEKTDGVGITVTNLVENLINKSAGTVAFNFMLEHFLKTYNISKDSDYRTIKNSMIEYFYYLLIDNNSLFKKKTAFMHDKLINIEYDDFQSVDILLNKLSTINLDKDYFVKQYKIFYTRNRCFINRKKNFKARIKSNQHDVLEIAYLGYLIKQNTSNDNLDWFNEQVREQICNDFKTDFENWVN